jgi:thiamine pyrophosphate-dependent acetolactate synthase large subunit-like protein
VTRADAVARVADRLPSGCLTIVCNGMIGRELHAHADSPARFYLIGAMGLAASVGLGLALVQPARTVVVFDGDGNVLMNMGALAGVAAAGTPNLFHVVFDNAAHGSTGNQRTISDRVPLERVAGAAGYRRTLRVRDEDALAVALTRFFVDPGPAMLLIEVAKGNKPGIGRVEPSPAALTSRFRNVVLGGCR